MNSIVDIINCTAQRYKISALEAENYLVIFNSNGIKTIYDMKTLTDE